HRAPVLRRQEYIGKTAVRKGDLGIGYDELLVLGVLFKKPIEQPPANRILLVEHAILREQIFRHKNFHVRGKYYALGEHRVGVVSLRTLRGGHPQPDAPRGMR